MANFQADSSQFWPFWQAHPVPALQTLKRLGVHWPCDVNDTALSTAPSGARGKVGHGKSPDVVLSLQLGF